MFLYCFKLNNTNFKTFLIAKLLIFIVSNFFKKWF